MRIDSTLMHHPMCLLLQKKMLESIFLYLLILPFINQMEPGDELNHASSPPPHLFLHWDCFHPLWQSGPLADACHGQPLTGNWVFIRLPVRERCSVFIWHNYQEKLSLPPPLGHRHGGGWRGQGEWKLHSHMWQPRGTRCYWAQKGR